MGPTIVGTEHKPKRCLRGTLGRVPMPLWAKKSKPEESQTPKAEAPKQLSAADMHKQEAASAQLLFRFGEIVSVLTRSPQFRAVPLGEVQALVLPPLMSGQFLVAEARSKSQGFITPVAIALWAKVSKQVDERLSENLDQPITLAPAEWKSGDIAWLIVLAGNAQAIGPVLNKFQETTLKGQPLKMRVKGKDGKTIVTTISGLPN